MSIRRNLVALCGAAVLALLATGSETHAARAAAARLKSIVPMVLDDTVVDDETGQDVILFGLFHVQTTMYPSDSTVTIHANVTGEFVAYSPPKPTSEFGERLNALLEQARGLKDQMPDVPGPWPSGGIDGHRWSRSTRASVTHSLCSTHDGA